MKDNPKDPKITNTEDNDSVLGYKPNQENIIKPLEPATDADNNGTKPEKEISDTDHDHSYTPPSGVQPVVTEETQNSNPGNVHNADQGANQLN